MNTLFTTAVLAVTTAFTPLQDNDANKTADLAFAASENSIEMGTTSNPFNNPRFLKKAIGMIESFNNYMAEEVQSYDPKIAQASLYVSYVSAQADRYKKENKGQSNFIRASISQVEKLDELTDALTLFNSLEKNETISDMQEALEKKLAAATNKKTYGAKI